MKDLNNKITVLAKYLLEIILMTAIYAILDNMDGMEKYVVIIMVCLLFLFLGRKKRWSLEVLTYIAIPVAVYVLLGSFSALISVNSQVTTVKVLLYWIVPLLFSFALYTYYGKDMTRIVDVQFWGCLLAYAIFDAPYFMKIFQWESIYAFSFGIFAIYYACKKRWIPFITAILFVFFAEKRIALLAVFAVLLLLGILWLFEQNKKLALAFWGLIIAVVYIYLYLIYSGTMEAFCWGANINTNGRVEMYSRMANEFEFSIGFLGEGIGVVENLLKCWHISTYSNLHNDLLKFYIELGFCGLLIFLLGYAMMFYLVEKKFGRSKMSFFFGIAVYTMMLFATDNVSIYMIYLIPMYSTFFAVLASEKQVKIE